MLVRLRVIVMSCLTASHAYGEHEVSDSEDRRDYRNVKIGTLTLDYSEYVMHTLGKDKKDINNELSSRK